MNNQISGTPASKNLLNGFSYFLNNFYWYLSNAAVDDLIAKKGMTSIDSIKIDFDP